MKLETKVALITGAAQGQGAREAELFVAEGATVVLADVLDDQGEQLAKQVGDRARYAHLDVTSEGEWQRVVADVLEEHGRIDVLVNNAGIFRSAPLAETTLEDYKAVVDVDQVGVFLGMRAVAPAMVAAGAGSIVNISSVLGLLGAPGSYGYVAAKFAVRGMTKAAAAELGPSGVRVNAVHPGTIDTEMSRQASGRSGQSGAMPGVPLGRRATADEVSQLVLFLASDQSSYCTGGEFVIDGGLTATLHLPRPAAPN